MRVLGYVQGAAMAAIALGCIAPALADDPRDPTMTPEAIARDAATIRRLNQDQLAYVRQRDAGYAQGWRDQGAADDDDAGYTADRRAYADSRSDYAAQRREYAAQRSEYEQAMRAWRRDVAACRAGYYERCAR
jgi:hypothetical protein